MEIHEIHSLFLQSEGITTDSRTIKENQIFFALKGENFDGNKYAQKAIESGASYAIIDDSQLPDNEKFIKVDDTLDCLQKLATFHRDFLNIPIIAITGTNGKTTTKELISSALSKKYNLGFTQGNFNNHIGVPLTLLSFSKNTELAVVEMGANHPGEIQKLCDIAKPNYGIITNIGKAHLEGFGSFEGVVRTKSELYNYLRNSNESKIFVNADDDLLIDIAEGLSKVSYSSKAKSADINVGFVSSNPFLQLEWNGSKISTNLVGDYNLPNAAAAICVADYFSVPKEQIIDALSEYKPQNKRSQLIETKKNNTVVVDAYNANPESMRLSINNFAKLEDKEKVVILGDMLELGKSSSTEHGKILELLKSLEIKNAFLVGKEFNTLKDQYPQYKFIDSTKTLCSYISENQINNKVILLKASRGIKLEDVILYL